MKNILLCGCCFLFAAGCNNQHNDKDVTADTAAVVTTVDSAAVNKDSHYFWEAGADAKGKLQMQKVRPLTADSVTAGSIVQLMNDQYPEIQLQYIKISGDSIFLKVSNSKYLTQQSGSSGAESYLAEATFNLTELNGINYVDIQFKEGDHAAPGTYARTNFVND